MKEMVRLSLCILIIISLGFFSYAEEEEARLLRFPTAYGDQVVFSYAGDLFAVSTQGGVARKLTNHQGYEMFPHFSPDGKWLAFTGQYDGNTEVYLMESTGGVPQRLTYTAFLSRDDVSDRMGPNNIVMAWKHDNKHIVFRSRMLDQNTFLGRLFETSVDGDMPAQLPLPRGGFCSFSPDDAQMAYNRVFREFRTWKRYRGGMADDIWIYDFKSQKITNMTNNPAQDIIPMWKDHRIYFLSDRDESIHMNLYVYDTNTKQTEKLTNFTEFDIKFPSLSSDIIAFENGGYIYLFYTETAKLEKLTVYIREDRLHARGGLKNVKDEITDFHLSPDGKRALFNARGEIFTVPAQYGNTRDLTNTPGVHERHAQWSPDGQYIAFISDKSGENEIYILKTDGKSQPVQITSGADTYYYAFTWSPDSKKILFSDRKFRLRYTDIEKKNIVEIFKSNVFELRDFDWSPDSQWIAYTNPEDNNLGKIYLYSLTEAKSFPVTDNWYNANTPCFSRCGKYLFFVSNRDFNPMAGDIEFSFIFPDMSRIYLVTLAKDTPSPFKPKSDEAEIQVTQPIEPKKPEKEEKKPLVTVKVDIEGIANRIIDLPLKPSRYGNLVSLENKLYVLRRGTKDEKTQFLMYDLEKQKETALGEISGYVISTDGKKMLLAQQNTYAIIDRPESTIEIKTPLNLDRLEMTNWCPRCEWKNIFYESWRQMRDFFYVENMHGVDWELMKKRYEPLLKHVNHRNDLTYIIGEMIGELNIGHAYTGGGERPALTPVKVGLLGAELERDAKTGYYRITRILEGQNWDKNLVSPLQAVGVDIKTNDYILAIDGQSTADMKNIYQALNNTVGQQVRLTVNSVPDMKGSREQVVVPVESVLDLYYFNWIRDNIRKVEKATGGKVGYLHIPDMSLDGLVAFIKYYLPQLRKKALIIDVRGNGGGFVSEIVIEHLRRQIAMVDMTRYARPTTNPLEMIYGPLICLADEFSASDGDIFPYRFKKYQLGTIVGKRTWGGVVGIRNPLPLLDGGQLFRPEFASFDDEGKGWVIEGYGVEPDVYIDNDPAKEFAGEDEQLNKAIELILEQLKTKEKQLPPQPADPKKPLTSNQII